MQRLFQAGPTDRSMLVATPDGRCTIADTEVKSQRSNCSRVGSAAAAAGGREVYRCCRERSLLHSMGETFRFRAIQYKNKTVQKVHFYKSVETIFHVTCDQTRSWGGNVSCGRPRTIVVSMRCKNTGNSTDCTVLSPLLDLGCYGYLPWLVGDCGRLTTRSKS